MAKLKILFSASEVAPFAKAGGLADVVGSLPKQLVKMGIEARVLTPRYEQIDLKKVKVKKIASINIPFGHKKYPTTIYETRLPDSKVVVYLLDQETMLSKGPIYQTKSADKNFLIKRFLFLSFASLYILPKINFQPDIIHAHDWHTASICTLLSMGHFSNINFYQNIKTLLTLHNIQHQPKAPKTILDFLGLGNTKLNILEQGIQYSDFLNTVSPQYAKDIKTWAYGYGLEKVIRSRGEKAFGILNGIDTQFFNPKTDPSIIKNYSIKNLDDKKNNKKSLQKELNLPAKETALIVATVTRLATQKGVEFMIQAIGKFKNPNIQFIILGTGSDRYEIALKKLQKKYPKNFSYTNGFDLNLASRIYAGADTFMMPSLFEPCGLGQMIAMRYGTLPVVRDTGGLHDTVTSYNKKKGTGFLFNKSETQDFINTIRQAEKIYKFPEIWRKLQQNAMKKDFSWEKSAIKYQSLYNKIIKLN